MGSLETELEYSAKSMSYFDRLRQNYREVSKYDRYIPSEGLRRLADDYRYIEEIFDGRIEEQTILSLIYEARDAGRLESHAQAG